MQRATIGIHSFLLIFLLAGAGAAQERAKLLSRVDPATVGMDVATLTKIERRLQEFVEEKQISGAVSLVAKDGKIVHFVAVGQADLDENRPMREDTLFAIASMTKPITATAVMIL